MGVAPEMRKSVGVAIAAVLAVGSVSGAAEVKVVPDEGKRRVDVTVDGKPFTAYTWPGTLKKPVLYTVRSARGTLVTSGWPLDPSPGEREGNRLALANIRERLSLVYGERALMKSGRFDAEYIVTLRFPLIEKPAGSAAAHSA